MVERDKERGGKRVGRAECRDLAIALKWARAFRQVRAMQREIHRMRLRYAQLQRRQEQMITEMERAIYKRDNIEAKGKLSAAKKGAAPTHASLNKEISELKAKLSGALHDSGVAAAAVASLQGAHAAEGEKLGEAGARLSEAKAHSARLDQTINVQERITPCSNTPPPGAHPDPHSPPTSPPSSLHLLTYHPPLYSTPHSPRLLPPPFF